MKIIYPTLKNSISSICIVIFILDISSPIDYVFGHLYIVPILLTACKLYARRLSFPNIIVATANVTKAAVWLVLVNFSLFGTGLLDALGVPTPHHNHFSLAIFVNVSNVIAVLFLTDWLIRASLKYMQQIAIQAEQLEIKQAELVTKKAELLAQQEVERVQQDFMYTLTHDLKTPLIGAIRVLEYFRQGKYGRVDRQQIKVLETLIRGQRRSYHLVEMLLDVYRNDHHGLILDCQPLDLCELAAEAIDTLAILAADREISLKLSCDRSTKSSPRLIGDPFQLDRVFTNLLTNAIYHSPNQSKIEITIEYDRGYFTTCICDCGRGIDSADLPFLFDRFYQSHDKLTGSGLGLYLSRQIVTAHHGEIWAESLQPRGAKFSFKLPTASNCIDVNIKAEIS
jgi:two-component system, NarL family, sensor kinase